jgi:16S rRNA (guanine1207-N2)-methyltransferase
MTDRKIHAVYGQPPHQLVEIPADAQQFSPLVPNSAQMKTFADGSVASFTIHAPPGTLERRYVLARALKTLAVGAPLMALAGKDKGGSRIAAELKAFGCAVVDTPRAHHRIVTTTRPAELTGIEEAISAGGPQLHPSHGLFTHPGVFSWDRLDAGSALLLEHLPVLAGNGADLGCGIGVLGRAVLKSPNVTGLTLVDIDRRAVAMAEKNIDDPRAKFLWADLRELHTDNLDFVVMNPPFHNSGIEDQSLGQLFITRAAAMLKPRGQLWLIANIHLPYEALLKKNFYQWERIAENALYKIYKCIK